jgi:hypothetical protein
MIQIQRTCEEIGFGAVSDLNLNIAARLTGTSKIQLVFQDRLILWGTREESSIV